MNFHMSRPRDDDGVTAVEYALVIGLVSLLMLVATVSLGTSFTVWARGLADTIGALLS